MMKMLKTLYKSGMVVAIAALSACSSDSLIDREIVPGDSRILLAGAITRGTTGTPETLDGYMDLFLSAKTAPETGTPADYFTNVEMKVGEAYTGETNARYLNANAYYPLGGKEIKLFAHTGKLNNGKIALTAGTDKGNDYLISNGDDGSGTAANSTDKNATELKFRHIMTKVEVVVKVTDDANKKPESTPQTVKIELNKVFKDGTYALTTSPASDNAENKAVPGTGLYVLTVGTHYLIPTGETLSDQPELFKSLTIDDYTATKPDLDALSIPKVTPEGGNTGTEDFVLKPGYSYKLTFEIERLRLSITVKKKDWDIKSGNGAWDYDSYQVKMQVDGGYANTGEKQITKIVLHHTPQNSSNTYQYIGSCKEEEKEGSKVVNANFLTLPTNMTGTLTADLYTKDGLLIEGHNIAYSAATGVDNPQQFTLSLGANGMTQDADGYYEVKTPLQFYYLMKNPEENTKYKLKENIDLNSLPLDIPQTDFPAGAELDGNAHSILHLNLKSSGLFKQNNGTLKHLHIAFSNIDASGSADTYVGGFCSVNTGTIEACINEADIRANADQTIGGICGKNNASASQGTDASGNAAGTIIACLNTGNIPTGHIIGGICGENANGAADAITACIHAGMLNKSSNHQDTEKNLGGICGLQSAVKTKDAVINSCYWLTGSARPQQGVSQEKAIGAFDKNIAKDVQVDYCTNTTNMTETLLRTEAVEKLNNALGTTSPWAFEYKENSTGTYNTVWPVPVANTPSNP